MLYKASIDGFSYKDYIGKVLNKKNLIFIVKSEHDKVFGAY